MPRSSLQHRRDALSRARPAGDRPGDVDPVTVSEVRARGGEASARIQIGIRVHEVTLRSSSLPVAGGADGFLTIALAPAMATGRPLHVEGEVSPALLTVVPRIQRLLRWGNPDLREVPVYAPPRREAPQDRDAGVGAFFSGGLDTFYTAVKRQREITHLVFIDGFDVSIPYERRRAQVREAVRLAASELEKPLIEVETNYRDFASEYVSLWSAHYGLSAAVAYFLAPQLGRIYRPGSTNYAEYATAASGSLDHLVIPLWSTERVDLVYDGFEASRCDKARFLARHDVALRRLRVCHQREARTLNCGGCEKCLRTTLNLWAAGSLERCLTLPGRLDLEAIGRLRVGPHQIECWEEILRALKEARLDPAVTGVVERVLRRSTPTKWSLTRLRRRMARLARSPLRGPGRRQQAPHPIEPS